MASAKIAITVPEDVLLEVDAAARKRGESRSRFISNVLRAALEVRRSREVTRRLDEVFANEGVSREQRRTTREMDAVGTDWSEENWK